jgi:hypothetical protein
VPKEQKPKLTASPAARVLGCCPGYARYLADIGRLRVERTTSGVRLFDPDDLEKFVAERERQRSAQAGQ